MKKIKLLPILGMGAVCATIAPIMLTSCNANRTVDLMEIYYPSIQRANKFTSDQSRTQLENWYFNEVSKNNEIYKEDFYYAHSIYMSYLTQSKIVSMIYSKAKISNISFSKITSSTNEECPALSCDIEYNYAGYPGTKSGLDEQYQDLLFEGSFSFKLQTVPMRLCWYNESLWIPGWASQINTTEVDGRWVISDTFDNKWKITENATVNVTKEVEEGGISKKVVTPFKTEKEANTQATYISNLVQQNPITKLTITDIATSYYMSKLNEVGK